MAAESMAIESVRTNDQTRTAAASPGPVSDSVMAVISDVGYEAWDRVIQEKIQEQSESFCS